MMGGWGGFGWSEMLLIALLMAIFWGGLAALVVLAISSSSRSRSGQSGGASTHRALEILKERYVRGEIIKEEYDQIRRDIAD